MIDLPDSPAVSPAWRRRLERLVQLTRRAVPPELPAVVRDELDVDLAARYAGIDLPHPFGKASGQLSFTVPQVEADVAAGVAFVVLKTVIAEDTSGARTMAAWAVPETRMRVERRRAPDGRKGWTVTWRGRGWTGTLDEYLDFFATALAAARERDVPVVPSVTYHLPAAGEPPRAEEYRHTTVRLLDVWARAGCGGPMVVEKDLSPTLAGDARAASRHRVLAWLRAVPELVLSAAPPGGVRLGVKLMNALFDDVFQVEMVRVLAAETSPRPELLVVFNRLFDLQARVAYGGWELSDRNLRVLDRVRDLPAFRSATFPALSASGNICSGRMMLAYALRGCENGQLHTFFQLPLSQYTATAGTRSARALHTLLLHPRDGLVVWLRHLHEQGRLEAREGAIRFLDAVEAARR